jgi:hypothetical protein
MKLVQALMLALVAALCFAGASQCATPSESVQVGNGSR